MTGAVRIAIYRCQSCGCRWEQGLSGSYGWDERGHFIQPEPPPSGCPLCGSLYMTWENAEDFGCR